MTPHGKPKILYVSDSLGTPIHPRGIFNYSVAALEILRSLGLEVTLVVEAVPEFGIGEGRTQRRLAREAPDVAHAMRLAEIYRYYAESYFSFDFEYGDPKLRALARRFPALIQAANDIAARLGFEAGRTFRNRPDLLDYVPAAGQHLLLADNILLQRNLYSRTVLRAYNRTGPIVIDAAGYDLAFIDTPHYVRLRGISRERVISVIHDLIPLEDAHLSGKWRPVFQSKLAASLAASGTLIFVSETTRETFRQLYPARAEKPHVVLYPAIRAGLLAEAEKREPPRTSYLRDLGPDRRATRLARQAASLPDGLPAALALGQVTREEVRGFLDPGPDWNPDLPFFATVVSDEPRKNIGIFVAAADGLHGRANLVVIGQVDGNRHMGGAPERYPNLHFTGYVTEAEKLDLIRGAAGLVFPSFSEGFGIPVVEGAVFGRPVICSDIPVFREITGGLADYVDPTRPDDLVRAALAILDGPAAAAGRAEALRRFCTDRYRQSAMSVRLGETLARMSGLPGLRAAA